MFKVLEYVSADERVTLLGEEGVAPPAAGTVRWIELTDPTEADLNLLRERFNFHPLALEDCSHLDQRPKLEEFRDHLFVVTQGVKCAATPPHALDLLELHAFLGNNYLVTVHSTLIPSLDATWERCKHGPSPLARGADFVYYLLADALTDLGFPVLDTISDELADIEVELINNPKQRSLERIFELRRRLATMRKLMAPQRETLTLLARHEHTQISERTALYLRDVADHLTRLNESIEMSRDLLNAAIEAYVSSASMRTNDIMKSLTLLSAVYLPLTFVVGFFGQNFENLPGLPHWTESGNLALVMVVFCMITPPAMFFWFKAKNWL